MTNRPSISVLSLLTTLASAVTVIFIVSCTPESADRRGPGATGGNPTPTLGGAGTTDSGGGTGLQDDEMAKMFEHFIKVPTKEPAYLKHIEPIFKNIKDSSGQNTFLEAILGMKNWYIAPVDFEKISKESLGVSFISTSTVQIARQTKRSVWISKELYEQQGAKESGSREQAETLLHEWAMSAYFLKFLAGSELCKFGLSEIDEKACHDGAALLDKISPPETPRALDEQDNENIRTVTAWLLQNGSRQIPVSELFHVMSRNGFDRRYFKPQNFDPSKDSLNEIKFSSQEVFHAIQGTERAGQMPSTCSGLTSHQNRPCKISFEAAATSLKSGDSLVPVKGIRVKIDFGDQHSKDVTMVIGDEVTLAAAGDGRDGVVYQLTLLELPTTVRIGDRLHHAVLWFRKENSGSQSALNLESVTLRSADVVSIDKNRNPICLVRMPQVKNFGDDQLTIRSSNAGFNIFEDVYIKTPPMGNCLADAVAN